MVNLQFYSRIIRRKLTEAEAVGCPGPRPEVRKRDSFFPRFLPEVPKTIFPSENEIPSQILPLRVPRTG